MSICAITTEIARVDIRANGFWSGTRNAYLDVRVFHPNAPSNASQHFLRLQKTPEDSKKTSI